MPLEIEDPKWKKFKTMVRTKYSKMRDHEIEATRGRLGVLVKKIKSRYRSPKNEHDVVIEKCAIKAKVLE
jgi:hypothetical protein